MLKHTQVQGSAAIQVLQVHSCLVVQQDPNRIQLVSQDCIVQWSHSFMVLDVDVSRILLNEVLKDAYVFILGSQT